jgi:transposase
MRQSTTTAGIDTGKLTLDVALDASNLTLKVDNTPEGWRQIARFLKANNVRRVGIEATGGYESGVLAHLRDDGVTVLHLQPMQVKAFARYHLKRAKNDHLDARLIAQCAASLQARKIPDKHLAGLASHLTYIEQIEEDIVRFKGRIEHARDPRIQTRIREHIAAFKDLLKAEKKRLIAELKAHPGLARRFALVLSIPGIGERTALALVIRMPELGEITREAAAALAGLAPFDDDSGKHNGHRHIAGGRKRLRRSLYAAALPAAFRWNLALIDLYARLKARGRTHKSALVACARKLLIYANTVVQRGAPWLPKPASI